MLTGTEVLKQQENNLLRIKHRAM